ncbi:MAG: hypothetical protein CMJ94_15170 [Planctomycetes bacterium]|nr:hypothetical protein [Planctomycetota bacterium]
MRLLSSGLLLALAATPLACSGAPVQHEPGTLPPGLDEAALRLAWEEAVQIQDWERAVAVRQRMAALDPRDGLRRLAVASALRQAGYPGAARREALALGADPRAAEGAQVLLAELETAEGAFLAAADRYQALAEAADQPERARSYWERVARMAELGGDTTRAVDALDRALHGLSLRDSERRALDRMRAFQAGEFRHVADAAEVALSHPDPALRLLAVDYLIGEGSVEAQYALADTLSDPDPAIPLLALETLARSEDPLVRSSLEQALDHPAREVRLAATEAFAVGADRQDAGALVRRLDPEDRALFRLQCQLLERLTDHVEELPLDAGPEDRAEIAQAWREWWQRDS